MKPLFWDHFSMLPDPRVERTRLHKLEDIITIAVCAVICGADSWVDIALFGRSKVTWLREFLALPNGIPSHDTFGRLFAALAPEAFERCFQSWVSALAGGSQGKLISIDGKTIRRSLDRASGKAAIHLVSAWVHENHAVFGQVATEAKSNEITAIPRLLKMLDLKDATITIDAMGCQKDIGQTVLEGGGQYLFALKGNQSSLHDDVRLFLDDAIERAFHQTSHDYWEQIEKGHGRIETRRLWCTDQIDWLKKRHDWPGLKSIAALEAHRGLNGVETVERRYFISSLPGHVAQRIAQAARLHWNIENELHWSLDVCFGEDLSRARLGNAAENLSRVRRLALTLLKQESTTQVGVKAKRLKAGWDEKYLLGILGIKI